MADERFHNNCVMQLARYLFIGKQEGNYQPGNWFVHKYFLTTKVNSIICLAGSKDKCLLPIKIIMKAFESDLVPNLETIIFALAVCCRQRESITLRHAAYTNVNKICTTPEHFILFIKFVSQISKQNELGETDAKNGWGQGLRKAANNWYLSKTPMELAKCVTKCKGRYGWKHKDIIKLSHPVPNNPGGEVVLKYIIRGLEEIEKTYGEDSRFIEIIQYLKNVEEFRHCTDEIQAAALIEMHKLTLDHIPGHLLKSKEVWNALIPSMNLNLLLNNLQRIHNLELLKPNSSTVSKVVDQIIKEQTKDTVHPALVLITIRDYENSGKPLTYEKRKFKEQLQKPLAAPPKPNIKILDALYKLLNVSFNHIQPTGFRYMVTINMNKIMLETNTWHSGNVNGAEAGCIIALALLRSEKHVTIATFKNAGVHAVSMNKTASFNQSMRQLQQMPVGNVNLTRPMWWAANQNTKCDVFINVVDRVSTKHEVHILEALQAYRLKMKLPNAKLINCAVCSSSRDTIGDWDKDILTISGFDSSVPTIIQAFARSLF